MPFFCMPFMACNRQVESLDRRSSNLQTIPADIERHARTLEELLLDMNHIKEMPKHLFRLHKLRHLGLSDNDIYRVPPEIAGLTALAELRLNRNDISDLPEELKECRELRILDLSVNPITRLPATITQLASLTHLGLNDVSLTQLPADIGMLANLQSLEVRENLIRALPPSITQLTRLRVLDLGQNELDQLPQDIGGLQALRELYVDQNDLELLPEQITRCRLLEQVDVSENKLSLLPEEIGDLADITDLNISQNALQHLPHSFGRLKKLEICKADKNAIVSLTPSIGSCERLSELMLCDNLLTEIPSSIGNLRCLKNLNVDKNQLSAVPPTIGGCQSLGVLSLRENKISELPMDIGKCENLAVLDLCNNKLCFLPFTVNVLFKLQALWLSEQQSQAMLKLQQERDPRTGVKVLTCYLLPQQSAAPHEPERLANRSFVGGPKVHFGDTMDNTVDIEEKALPIGQFERHDTPHPKPHGVKVKKQTIDGHIIQHDDDQSTPASLALTKKSSTSEMTSPVRPGGGVSSPMRPASGLAQSPGTSGATPVAAPRSALRYQSVPPTQYEPETSATLAGSTHELAPPRPTALPAEVQRSVAFSNGFEIDEGAPRLKRINTPHKSDLRKAGRSPMGEPQVRRIVITRDEQGGMGLSIAGGQESTPYKDGDHGLFVSKVIGGGPADRAGLRVGDKLLRVGDADVAAESHSAAVNQMKALPGQVQLTVLRTGDEEPASHVVSPNQSLDASFVSEVADNQHRETLTTTLRRDASGSPGFSVAGGTGTGRDVFISQLTPGGPADRDGKIMVGDRVLSINGVKMTGARHDQAVALLTGHADNEVYLIVSRERASSSSVLSPLPSSSTMGDVTPHRNTPTQQPARLTSPPSSSIARPPSVSTPVDRLGDTSSWDGNTEEVQLVKDGNSLGLSIVGGADHSSHPFGVRNPGVFVSKIAAGSPAERSRRLRIGDRILEVNERDVRKAKHAEAVDALKHAGHSVRLRVHHDAQPSGLCEKNVARPAAGTPLGVSIHGGVGSPPANPMDSTDEGIFIDRVEPGSVCDVAGLQAGQRIVEVNGESLLGCSQNEAAAALRRGSHLRLLVCDGYNSAAPVTDENSMDRSFAADDGGHAPSGHAHHERAVSPIVSPRAGDVMASSSPMRGVDGPLAASSPLPTTAQKVSKIPTRIPPPVAPKPTLKMSQSENITPLPALPSETPEKLTFSSKLKKFESVFESKAKSAGQLPPPEKKPLLSEQDMRKLKEEEVKKIGLNGVGGGGGAELASPERDAFFNQLLEESTVSIANGGSAKMPNIRTKKAENIAISRGLIQPVEETDEAARLAAEAAKRQEWRAARLKSLDQERSEADAIMKRLQLTPMLSSINESSGVSEDREVERSESVDPITGERTVTVVERSVRRREVDEIGFADE